MTTRTLAVILILLATTLPAMAEESTTSLPLAAGPTYVKVESLPENHSLTSIFGDSLPGAAGWAAATRILTADRAPVLGSYYDTRKGGWQGTLDQLEVGGAYWIVLPYGHPGLTLNLEGVGLTAGIPRIEGGGTMVTIEDGVTKVTPSTAPQSSATHEVVREKPTQITAGSSVYIQDQESSLGETMWVKVPLDTLFTGGKEMEGAVPVPLTGSGIATVLPPPDFSRPPWGRGDPPNHATK